jgi:hypothetical protein
MGYDYSALVLAQNEDKSTEDLIGSLHHRRLLWWTTVNHTIPIAYCVFYCVTVVKMMSTIVVAILPGASKTRLSVLMLTLPWMLAGRLSYYFL